MKFKDIDAYKSKIVERAERQITNSFGLIDSNQQALLSDYCDDAIDILVNWLKLKDETLFLNGNTIPAVCRYVVRTFQESGIEGQTLSNLGGDIKQYRLSPEQELKNSFVQRV